MQNNLGSIFKPGQSLPISLRDYTATRDDTSASQQSNLNEDEELQLHTAKMPHQHEKMVKIKDGKGECSTQMLHWPWLPPSLCITDDVFLFFIRDKWPSSERDPIKPLFPRVPLFLMLPQLHITPTRAKHCVIWLEKDKKTGNHLWKVNRVRVYQMR